MLIEISEGEALDRLSILEIKLNEIKDISRINEIKKEFLLYEDLNEIKIKFNIYYKLLYRVNKKIWDLTNTIKSINIHNNNFASIANDIFELNQQRFRLKNIINCLVNSHTKEQKSYDRKIFNGYLKNEDDYFNKLIELILIYDDINIYVPDNIKEYVRINFPNINFIEYTPELKQI